MWIDRSQEIDNSSCVLACDRHVTTCSRKFRNQNWIRVCSSSRTAFRGFHSHDHVVVMVLQVEIFVEETDMRA